MAGRGTTFALQASVVRPVKAPQLGDPAPPAGAAQREMSEAIEEAWRYSRYGEIHQAVKGKASVVSSGAFGPRDIDQRLTIQKAHGYWSARNIACRSIYGAGSRGATFKHAANRRESARSFAQRGRELRPQDRDCAQWH